MSTGTLPTTVELAREFNGLSHQIHRYFNDDPGHYFGRKGGETLFLSTGSRKVSEEEFKRIMELVEQCDLPLSATCHAKYGGFFFVLSNPRDSDKPEILFGFEVGQLPTKCRADLRARYVGTQNRRLLGAYAMGENIDSLLSYLDTSHSKDWAGYG